MAFVLAQHGRGVALVDDQDAVEELPAEATDEAFGDRVGAWCPHRCPDDADVDGGEDGVEGGGELGVAVADQKPEAPTGIIEVHEQVAGLLGEPGSGGVGSDAKDVHPAGGVLDDEEAIQPVQRDGVEVEQVAGEDSARLGSQELWPRGSAPTRRRVDAGAVQDLPDGGGADLVAEADEFAVDASVAPSGVLGGQADDQSAHAGGHGGSTRSGRLGRPAAGEELSVPAQDRARCDEQPEPAADGEQSAEGGDHGSVGPAHPRPRRPPSQHGELVAQDEDLDLLAGVGSAA